jgi:hypothetical protein
LPLDFNTMLLFPPPKVFRRRRGRKGNGAPAPPPPPFALALMSAVYDSDALTLLLTFNQSVSIAGFVGSAVSVLDTDISGWKYHGTAASQPTGDSVLMGLTQFQSSTIDGVHLTVTNASGIVRVNGGGVWSGVTMLVLPFP